jgi:hypothetical protein
MVTESLLPYAVGAVGLAAALALFLNMKRQIRAQTRRERRPPEPQPPAPPPVPVLATTPAEPELVYIPTPPRSGFNLNWRVQALRLLRRGEDAAHISAALGIPRCEVELLIRVQSMASRAASTR